MLTHKVEGALNVQCTHAGVHIFVSKIFQAIGLLSLLTMFSVCERQIEREGGLDEKQVQQVIKRQPATEMEIIKTTSVDFDGFTQLFGILLALLLPAVESE